MFKNTFTILAFVVLYLNCANAALPSAYDIKILSVVDKLDEKKVPQKIDLISNKKFLTTKNCDRSCESLKQIKLQIATFEYNGIGNPFFTVCEKASGIVVEAKLNKKIDLGCYFLKSKVYVNSHKAYEDTE